MSFILDALRKSERERQHKQEPGHAEMWAHGKRGNRAFWIPLVMLLVGLNLSLLVFLWIKGDPSPAEEVTTANADSDIAVVEAPATRPQQAIPNQPRDQASRRLSTEIPVADTVALAPAESATAVELAPPSSPPPVSDSGVYNDLPSLMELTLAGTISLPPLHLDIHVYSEQPAERFVFVNMKKYREGDTLSEGPVVDAITDAGVVLVHQRRRFILTRE